MIYRPKYGTVARGRNRPLHANGGGVRRLYSSPRNSGGDSTCNQLIPSKIALMMMPLSKSKEGAGVAKEVEAAFPEACQGESESAVSVGRRYFHARAIVRATLHGRCVATF